MVRRTRQPVVMTIAGFDPSGGAGVLADAKTISAFGCFAVAAITSITFQNTRQVFGANNQAANTVRQQVEAVVDDFEIAAIKTGILPTPEIVREVADLIKAKAIPIVVVDPVWTSTSGFKLIDDAALDELICELIPLASLVTPNAAEAQRITRTSFEDAVGERRAAEKILEMGARAVLITGGDSTSDLAADLLVDQQGDALYDSPRIMSRHTHGTGCTLASALASLLANGRTLRESIPIAKQYISEAIRNAPGLGHGNGP